MLTICALRGGIGRARPRRHLSPCQRGRSIVATGDPHNSDRIHGCRRPGRRRYVSRGRAAMPPVFSCGNTASPEKWLELLKEITPHVTRVAVLRESAIAAGPGQFGVIQAAAPSLGVELRPVDVRDAGEIERALTAFAQGSKGGLIVTGSPGALSSRADRCAGGSAPITRRLLRPLFRYRRWSNLLWA
jgi:hypothetical protein